MPSSRCSDNEDFGLTKRKCSGSIIPSTSQASSQSEEVVEGGNYKIFLKKLCTSLRILENILKTFQILLILIYVNLINLQYVV